MVCSGGMHMKSPVQIPAAGDDFFLHCFIPMFWRIEVCNIDFVSRTIPDKLVKLFLDFWQPYWFVKNLILVMFIMLISQMNATVLIWLLVYITVYTFMVKKFNVLCFCFCIWETDGQYLMKEWLYCVSPPTCVVSLWPHSAASIHSRERKGILKRTYRGTVVIPGVSTSAWH